VGEREATGGGQQDCGPAQKGVNQTVKVMPNRGEVKKQVRLPGEGGIPGKGRGGGGPDEGTSRQKMKTTTALQWGEGWQEGLPRKKMQSSLGA